MGSQTWAKFSKCGAKRQTGSRVRQDPCQTMGAASGAAGSMNMLWPAQRLQQGELARRPVRQGDVQVGRSSPP